MLKSRRNEILVALMLVAPFVAIYGWLFIYPTIQMVRLSFTNAPLIGAGDWVGLDNYVRLFADRLFRTRGLEHELLRPPHRHPRHAGGARHRADGEPAQGLDAEHGARGVLPALHPAGHGRLPDLAMDDRPSVRHPAIRHRADRRRSRSTSSAGRPGSCRWRRWSRSGGRTASASSSSSPDCGTFRRALRGGGDRRRDPLAAVRRDHLAADLAGDGALPDHPAHPAAQDLRPGLPVLDRRADQPDDGARPVHLRAGLRAQQRRLRARLSRWRSSSSSSSSRSCSSRCCGREASDERRPHRSSGRRCRSRGQSGRSVSISAA